jgi:drug/metabolite transporter (DMT)-like permease
LATLSDHQLGMAMSVGTALVWSSAVILLRRGAHVGPAATNLFKNTVGTVLTLATLLIAAPEQLHGIALEDAAILALSGVLGIAIGDVLFLAALQRLGAAWMALLDCAYAPTVVLVAVLWLGEPLSSGFMAGAALVVCGLVLATWRRGASEPVGAGLLLGALSIVVVAIGVVIAKPALGRTGLLAATAIRLAAGLLVQTLVHLPSARLRRSFNVFRDRDAMRTLLPAAILGTWLSMILWLGGTKYTAASTAAVLNQTATVFTLLGARFVLHEPVPARRWWGAALAAAGALTVATS